MRDYGKVSPQFWTGRTGRQIRAKGIEAQIVALYLMTSPGSSMWGIYYLPIPTLAHETGLPLEGASKGLRSLSEVGFAEYDADNEVVWVCEMAAHQVAESLSVKDLRHKAMTKELEKLSYSSVFAGWLARYGAAFNYPKRSPFEAPSKPLRSQEQEQEQKQEQKENPPTPASGGGVAPRVKTPRVRRVVEPSLPMDAEPPLPFTVGAGMDAMEAASDGCFTAAFDKRWAKQLTDAVRAHPAIEEWTRVGQWLAAGGLKFRNDLSAKWLANTPEVFAIAASWELRGAPNLGRSPAQSGSFSVPAAKIDDERAAFNAEIERQRAALAAIPMHPEALRRIEEARR